MRTCVEFKVLGPIERRVIDHHEIESSREDIGLWFLLPSDVEERFNDIARQHGRGIDFIGAVEKAVSNWEAVPWAIIAFDRDYALVGHLLQVKGKARDLRFIWYSPDRKEPSHLSVLFAMNKSILAHTAPESPLINAAWTMLADKPEHRHWFCLCGPLEEDWAARHESADAELRERLLIEGMSPQSVPAGSAT